MTTKEFWIGAILGVAGVWAYHRFVKPLPGKGQ